MRCRICGEHWDMDSAHEAVSEFHGDEVDALRAKYERHPRRHRWDDPFQAEYERKFFGPMMAKFRAEGCRAFDTGASYCQPDESTASRSATLGALADLLGDDYDGMESMIEDAEQLGLLL